MQSGDLWVFGYGSLIWEPGFDFVERRLATLEGYRRAFCMASIRYRGTPEAPGLMMALMAGGRCAGLVLEVDEAEADAAIDGLVRRETPFVENEPDWRWITVDLPSGKARALVFWAGPRGPSIRRALPLDLVARQLAAACGYRGSCAEYLRNTVESLEEAGLHDSNLWRLQHMVAEEIDRIFPAG